MSTLPDRFRNAIGSLVCIEERVAFKQDHDLHDAASARVAAASKELLLVILFADEQLAKVIEAFTDEIRELSTGEHHRRIDEFLTCDALSRTRSSERAFESTASIFCSDSRSSDDETIGDPSSPS